MNPDLVIWQRIQTDYWRDVLKVLIGQHVKHTGSVFAEQMLVEWERSENAFWQVVPKEMLGKLEHPVTLEPAETLIA